MRCIAIDTPPPVLEMLAYKIRQVPYLQLMGTFPNIMQTAVCGRAEAKKSHSIL